MASISYPGVYVDEVASGVRTIVGVGTSTALFVGAASKGRVGRATRITSYPEFIEAYSDSSDKGEMPDQVKLFFDNGGTDCYVMRIAQNASSAAVTLTTENNADTLTLTAKEQGASGGELRALVNYNTSLPEATFNIQIFRYATNSSGVKTISGLEEFNNLSMDPNSALPADEFISQESKLVSAANSGVGDNTSFSRSGRAVSFDSTDVSAQRAMWETILGNLVSSNVFYVSVDGTTPVEINFSAIDVAGMADTPAFEAEFITAIDAALSATSVTAQLVTMAAASLDPASDLAPADRFEYLQFNVPGNSSIVITPANSNDLSIALMLGSAQGGLEVGLFADARPAANGISVRLTSGSVAEDLAELRLNQVTSVTLDKLEADGSYSAEVVPIDLVAGRTAENPLFLAYGGAGTPTNNANGLRANLQLIADAVNDYRTLNPTVFYWQAEVWGDRLNFQRTNGGENESGNITLGSLNIMGPVSAWNNVRYSSVGLNGSSGNQNNPQAGSDGNAPAASDYDAAYTIVERDVDLFNILCLPSVKTPAQPLENLWAAASIFCQSQRAFLVMDPPASWTTAQLASTGVAALRTGLVKDHASVSYPKLLINKNGLVKSVGPSGAIAGLMARIDSSRGVWKAPAGTEADLRGIVGVESNMSDRENGFINPQGVNAIRAFPNGIVSWGARTMAGADSFASEWKYTPVRRLALFMEESLYRGLKWVVFEPNDEPLWSQIRLNVGAFMHNLFRQKAFQGLKPGDAYFVKCDSQTTTQNDINLGIVNIWIGFAPLKPAEFVVLKLQQIAGSIEV